MRHCRMVLRSVAIVVLISFLSSNTLWAGQHYIVTDDRSVVETTTLAPETSDKRFPPKVIESILKNWESLNQVFNAAFAVVDSSLKDKTRTVRFIDDNIQQEIFAKINTADQIKVDDKETIFLDVDDEARSLKGMVIPFESDGYRYLMVVTRKGLSISPDMQVILAQADVVKQNFVESGDYIVDIRQIPSAIEKETAQQTQKAEQADPAFKNALQAIDKRSGKVELKAIWPLAFALLLIYHIYATRYAPQLVEAPPVPVAPITEQKKAPQAAPVPDTEKASAPVVVPAAPPAAVPVEPAVPETATPSVDLEKFTVSPAVTQFVDLLLSRTKLPARERELFVTFFKLHEGQPYLLLHSRARQMHIALARSTDMMFTRISEPVLKPGVPKIVYNLARQPFPSLTAIMPVTPAVKGKGPYDLNIDAIWSSETLLPEQVDFIKTLVSLYGPTPEEQGRIGVALRAAEKMPRDGVEAKNAQSVLFECLTARKADEDVIDLVTGIFAKPEPKIFTPHLRREIRSSIQSAGTRRQVLDQVDRLLAKEEGKPFDKMTPGVREQVDKILLDNRVLLYTRALVARMLKRPLFILDLQTLHTIRDLYLDDIYHLDVDSIMNTYMVRTVDSVTPASLEALNKLMAEKDVSPEFRAAVNRFLRPSGKDMTSPGTVVTNAETSDAILSALTSQDGMLTAKIGKPFGRAWLDRAGNLERRAGVADEYVTAFVAGGLPATKEAAGLFAKKWQEVEAALVGADTSLPPGVTKEMLVDALDNAEIFFSNDITIGSDVFAHTGKTYGDRIYVGAQMVLFAQPADIARLLLEEAKHLVIAANAEKGIKAGDPDHAVIEHDQALRDRLLAVTLMRGPRAEAIAREFDAAVGERDRTYEYAAKLLQKAQVNASKPTLIYLTVDPEYMVNFHNEVLKRAAKDNYKIILVYRGERVRALEYVKKIMADSAYRGIVAGAVPEKDIRARVVSGETFEDAAVRFAAETLKRELKPEDVGFINSRLDAYRVPEQFSKVLELTPQELQPQEYRHVGVLLDVMELGILARRLVGVARLDNVTFAELAKELEKTDAESAKTFATLISGLGIDGSMKVIDHLKAPMPVRATGREFEKKITSELAALKAA